MSSIMKLGTFKNLIELNDEVVRLHKEGLTHEDIVLRTGVSVGIVGRALKARGIASKRVKRK